MFVGCTGTFDDPPTRDAGSADTIVDGSIDTSDDVSMDAMDSEPMDSEPMDAIDTMNAPDALDSGADDADAADDVADTNVDAEPPLVVDRTDPALHAFEFTPSDVDGEATMHDATQLAYLDTRSEPRGVLVVYLHGAGSPSTCGSRDHGQLLADRGFHVLSPCYVSDYGVGNCDDDIGGCRLEAFEGVDHHDFISISRPNSAEGRIVAALAHLDMLHPGGDWSYFLSEDGEPRWDRIIVSGISHGASSSGVIGMNRLVRGVVMLSGPLDSGQAWLRGDPITPIERFYGFTHEDDSQHPGHLNAFEDLRMVGEPIWIDDAEPPYEGSTRFRSRAETSNGHSATQAGSRSPREGDSYTYEPVWDVMYGVD